MVRAADFGMTPHPALARARATSVWTIAATRRSSESNSRTSAGANSSPNDSAENGSDVTQMQLQASQTSKKTVSRSPCM